VDGRRIELLTSALRTPPAVSRIVLQEQALAGARAGEGPLPIPSINRRVLHGRAGRMGTKTVTLEGHSRTSDGVLLRPR